MSAPSLRQAYNPSTPTWTFDAPPASSQTYTPSTSTRVAQQPRVDLPLPTTGPALPELDAASWPRKALLVLLIQYATTGIAMPFEVGKVLSQVEWMPKEGVQEEQLGNGPEEDDDGEESDASSNGPSYFHDPSPAPLFHPPTRPRVHTRPSAAASSSPAPTRLGIHHRPPWVLPPYGEPGVWGMLKRVSRARGEGVWTLWNGQLPSTVLDILTSTLQPVLQSVLSSLPFFPAASPLSPIPHPFPSLLSHLLTAFILLPLDHLRTHLILSPSPRSLPPSPTAPSHPRPRLHLPSLLSQYAHPHLLLPTLLTAALPHLLSHILLPRLPATAVPNHPLTQPLLSLALSSVSLLLTLPFETVKRRLQAQTPLNLVDPVPAHAQPQHRVLTRPTPYYGVLDALYRIVTEETGERVTEEGVKRGVVPSWWASTGVAQLYRGYGMALSAGFVVFILGFVGGDGSEGGWAEL